MAVCCVRVRACAWWMVDKRCRDATWAGSGPSHLDDNVAPLLGQLG